MSESKTVDLVATAPTPNDRAEIAITRAEHYRQIYINNMRAGFTQYDVQISVARLAEIAPLKYVMEEQAMLLMAPAQALAMIEVLRKTIESYEQQFGAIKLAPDSVRQIANADDVKALSSAKVAKSKQKKAPT